MPQQILFPMNPQIPGFVNPLQHLIIDTVKALVPQIMSSIQASQQQISIPQQPISQPQPPINLHPEVPAPARSNLPDPVVRDSDMIRRPQSDFQQFENDRFMSSSMRGDNRAPISESGDHRNYFSPFGENRAQNQPRSSGHRYSLLPDESRDVVENARSHNSHGDRNLERSDIRRVRDWDDSREDDRFMSRRPRHSDASSMLPDRRLVQSPNQDARRIHDALVYRREYDDVRVPRQSEFSQRSRDIPTHGSHMDNADIRLARDSHSLPFPRQINSQGATIASQSRS